MKFVLSQAGLRQIFTCRVCATLLGESMKGFDYRCADCHKKAEGWC